MYAHSLALHLLRPPVHLNRSRPHRFTRFSPPVRPGSPHPHFRRRISGSPWPPSASMDPVAHDSVVAVFTAGVALSLLRFWAEMAKRGVFEQKLNRKLVHISIGLVFMLFWPMFSSGGQAPFLAALAPGINIIRMALLGLGILRDEAAVKSISRQGDYRELLRGPLFYASTITLATLFYWRTSPIGIAAICNLCAGDAIHAYTALKYVGLQHQSYTIESILGIVFVGVADIMGRRFGRHKLPYNDKKSFIGSVSMACAGFLVSVGYMHYFSSFGFMKESWDIALRFLFVSVSSAIIESLPISTDLDDNLTVPLTSFLLGSAIF